VTIAYIVPRLIVAFAEDSQLFPEPKSVKVSVNSPLLLELLEAAVVDVVRQVFSEVVIEPFRPKVFAITIYPHVYVLGDGLLALEASRVTELDPARSTV
tara:strand:+ start:108 stop:404 length:297 start_codon:yes stop_codon:yes gene_type:complete